ncbi:MULTISPECIES: hypothetical protein [unclassified Motilimonas]|uniref:hypothetical protein n=1 Tax=Motilimonas TaxID=1914248 RepID=UPI001E4E61EA|nr:MULTISPECIES: hypothetical protein [unclassified Motilimonas]MCE0557061.1 hypothetical protein [Motilimonas sp. E26]MDO6524294.1 hypothetical protein [Motilimonas sp. 1_MG-2023]
MQVSGNSGLGQEAWQAAIGKKQQQAEGQQALQLIQSATAESSGSAPKPDPSSSIGQNINIQV